MNTRYILGGAIALLAVGIGAWSFSLSRGNEGEHMGELFGASVASSTASVTNSQQIGLLPTTTPVTPGSVAHTPSLPSAGGQLHATDLNAASKPAKAPVKTAAVAQTPALPNTGSSSAAVTISQASAVNDQLVKSSQKDIVIAHIKVAASSADTLTHIALGSAEANNAFNYLENMRLINSRGGANQLVFENRYSGAFPLYRLDAPVFIPAGGSVTLTLIVDAKPDLALDNGEKINPIIASGGITAKGTAVGNVTGASLTFSK